MVPLLYWRNRPVVYGTPRNRDRRAVTNVEADAQALRERIHRERVPQEVQQDWYVRGSYEYGVGQDHGRSRGRSSRSEVASSAGRTEEVFGRFMHHRDRGEDYRRQVEDSHRRREREIQDRRRLMYDRPSSRRYSEPGGYRRGEDYGRRVEYADSLRPEYGSSHRRHIGYGEPEGYRRPAAPLPRSPSDYASSISRSPPRRFEQRDRIITEERTPSQADRTPRRGREETPLLRRRAGCGDLHHRTYEHRHREARGSLYEDPVNVQPRRYGGYDDYPAPRSGYEYGGRERDGGVRIDERARRRFNREYDALMEEDRGRYQRSDRRWSGY